MWPAAQDSEAGAQARWRPPPGRRLRLRSPSLLQGIARLARASPCRGRRVLEACSARRRCAAIVSGRWTAGPAVSYHGPEPEDGLSGRRPSVASREGRAEGHWGAPVLPPISRADLHSPARFWSASGETPGAFAHVAFAVGAANNVRTPRRCPKKDKCLACAIATGLGDEQNLEPPWS